MSNAVLTVDAKDFIRSVTKDMEQLKHVAHMGVRAGCITAGRLFRTSVRSATPILKPHNVWGTWKNSTKSRNRYPLVPGELRKSIYLSYSRRYSDIPGGYIRYIVGLPYNSGQGGWVPGWYGHIVNSGFYKDGLSNFWVRLKTGGHNWGQTKKFPLEAGHVPTGVNPGWRPYKKIPKTAGFVGRGYRAVAAKAQMQMQQKTKHTIDMMLRSL